MHIKTSKSHQITLKRIIWNYRARNYVKDLDQETKKEIGVLLMILQSGQKLGEPQSKSFRTLHDEILIPHAFLKKTQKTPKIEIETAKLRLKALLKGLK